MRYPDSQAGHFRSFELSTFPASNDEQGNSSDQRQPAEYGWNGNSVLSVCRDMHWSYIHYLFVMGVIKSLIGEHEAAQNNQENSNPNDRFHTDFSSSQMTYARRPETVCLFTWAHIPALIRQVAVECR